MENVAVLGSFYGDEAKSRIVNYLSSSGKYKYVFRQSGSENAGHTLYYNGKKIVRNVVPSIDFSVPGTYGVLGSSMVLNPTTLLAEIKRTESEFPGAAARLIIDPDVFLITPEHLIQDQQNQKTIGSTGKGVGPAYRDKVDRKSAKLSSLLKLKDPRLEELKGMGVQFKYAMELDEEFDKHSIIFEGAQSILLDISLGGTYPFVTSGECGLNGIMSAGMGKYMPKVVYGVGKVYGTRVGSGPFPTELFGEESDKLRELGKEYGATTGRPRRVGWLDLPALRYAKRKGGITHLIITKFDILNGMKEIPVCYKYDKEPMCGDDFTSAKPEYTMIPGWEDGSDEKQVQPFIEFVEKETGLKIAYVSHGVGPCDIRKC